jgi:hypothetical protein
VTPVTALFQPKAYLVGEEKKMNTSTSRSNQRLWTTPYQPPNCSVQEQEEEYRAGYFGGIYRASLLIFAIAAAIFVVASGIPGLIGVCYGALVSLLSLRVLELIVRRFLRPGDPLNGVRLAIVLILKLPVLGVVLCGAVWLVVHQFANVFAVVGGVALVSAVIFLKAAELLLVSLLPPAPRPAQAPVHRVGPNPPALRRIPLTRSWKH